MRFLERLTLHERNYCGNVLKKTKGQYFANIKINNIADNKKFWQTVKSLEILENYKFY